MPIPTALPWVTLQEVGPADAVAVGDFIDAALRGDAFIPRRQLAEIISRPISSCYAVFVEDEFAGVAITYHESELHNLILAPWCRNRGVGRVVVEALSIQRVRVKTNMKSGNPMGFYESLGFTARNADANRPHIVLAEKQPTPSTHAVTEDCHQMEPVKEPSDAAIRAAAAKWFASKALAAERQRKRNAEKRASKTANAETAALTPQNGVLKAN